MKPLFIFLFSCGLLTIFLVCSKSNRSNNSNYTKKTYQHEIIAFYPTYRHQGLPINKIDFDKITRIIYAFAELESDGTLNTWRLTELKKLVKKAHRKGVEVYISVGGANEENSKRLTAIGKDKELRKNMIRSVHHILDLHYLDGIDIDWEYWNRADDGTILEEDQQGLVDLLGELKTKLGTDFGISIDVAGSDWNGMGFKDEVISLVNQVHVMAYDYSGAWSKAKPHSSFEDAIGFGNMSTATGLAYWANYRQWDKDKLYLGLPFYGRDFDSKGGKGIMYQEILEKHPTANIANRVKNIYYNGQNLIRQKAEYVKSNDYPGVMIWELGQDVQDNRSLLKVIKEVFD